jgi:hypothetical protein
VATGFIDSVAIRGCILLYEGKGYHTLERPLSDHTGRYSGMACNQHIIRLRFELAFYV